MLCWAITSLSGLEGRKALLRQKGAPEARVSSFLVTFSWICPWGIDLMFSTVHCRWATPPCKAWRRCPRFSSPSSGIASSSSLSFFLLLPLPPSFCPQQKRLSNRTNHNNNSSNFGHKWDFRKYTPFKRNTVDFCFPNLFSKVKNEHWLTRRWLFYFSSIVLFSQLFR